MKNLQAMFLNFKSLSLFVCLLCIDFAFAQDGNTIKEESRENEQQGKKNDNLEQDDHYGIFEIGPYFPIAIGTNFANEAQDQKVGVQAAFAINLFNTPALLGLKYTRFESDVTNSVVLGNYNNINVSTFGLVLGYHVLLKPKWRATTTFSVSSVTYNNKANDFEFVDSGTSLEFRSSVGYHFNKNIGIYFAPTYRVDFLDIKAPAKTKDFLDSANYITFSLGIRFVI